METAISIDFQQCGEAEPTEVYSSGRSENAFAELVRRPMELVYSSELRQVGNSAAASGVTQVMIVELA